jgi:hypothetical protein
MGNDLDQRIQERAYEIWEREGRSGDPEEHWYRAEQELRDVPPATEGSASGGRAAEDKIIDKLGDFA